MLSILYGRFSDNSSERFSITFGFLQEQDDKVEEKGDTCIDEYIRSIRYPEYSTDQIHCIWKEGKKEKSTPHSEKYEEVESVKTLSSRDIISRKRYDNPRYDEKYL
jgi:hypothetical protein